MTYASCLSSQLCTFQVIEFEFMYNCKNQQIRVQRSQTSVGHFSLVGFWSNPTAKQSGNLTRQFDSNDLKVA